MRHALAAMHRLTLVPLLVRSGLFLSAVTALLLAAPPELRGSPPVLLGLLALAGAAAVAPGGPVPGLVLLTGAAGWVLATELFDQPVRAATVLVLAALLYLVHSLAGLAAALPTDALVAPDLVLAALARAGGVIAAGSLLAAAGLAVLGRLPEGRSVAAALAGLGLAVALAWLLARRARAGAASRP